MNAFRRWLVKRHQQRIEAARQSDIALAANFERMARNGICEWCYGKGAYDDPPWGIIRCSECGGTGKKP
jgi:hypothetical protein